MKFNLKKTPPVADISIEQARTTITPGNAMEILQNASIAEEQNLYILGSYENRVTIHSQQIRALNLLYALKSTGRLNTQAPRIAIVGGGIGGMTAAVAAAKLQTSVTIFERHTEFLHNLRGCHTRHLHPNIYDWPSDIALQDQTDLPFLNWGADTADRVAAKLLAEWEGHVRDLKIRTHPSAAVQVRSASPDGSRRITVTSGMIQELTFDIVILAVGFGLEKAVPPQPLRSYWRDDALHQPEIEMHSMPTKYLVSGNGDGGLIDLLRLRLLDFRHEDLLKEFESEDLLKKVKIRLNDIENAVRDQVCTGLDPSENLYTSYAELDVPKDFDAHIQKRLRRDTEVIFNYTDWPFSHRSSIFHRFLVSRLLRIDRGLSVLPGQIIAVEGHEPALTGHFRTDAGDIEAKFNRLVVRHGPNSALMLDFPRSDKLFRPVLKARNAFDTSRRPAWPAEFFGIPGHVIPERTTVEANLARGAVESQVKTMGTNAIHVRDTLLGGPMLGLESKLRLLSSEERGMLFDDLADRALTDDRSMKALVRLLQATELPASRIQTKIERLVRDAVFGSSSLRMLQLLELGDNALLSISDEVRLAFFTDILSRAFNGQMHYRGYLIPKLVDASMAVPEELYVQFVTDLLNLAAMEPSRTGILLSKEAMSRLPDELTTAFLQDFDLDLMNDQDFRAPLLHFLLLHTDKFPADRAFLLNDFIEKTEKLYMLDDPLEETLDDPLDETYNS